MANIPRQRQGVDPISPPPRIFQRTYVAPIRPPTLSGYLRRRSSPTHPPPRHAIPASRSLRFPLHPPSLISFQSLPPRPQSNQTRLRPPLVSAPGTSEYLGVPPRRDPLLRADFQIQGFGEEAAGEPLVEVRAGVVGGGHEGAHILGGAVWVGGIGRCVRRRVGRMAANSGKAATAPRSRWRTGGDFCGWWILEMDLCEL